MRTHIVAADLVAHDIGAGAVSGPCSVCSNQVELFNSTFGGKAEITQHNMTIAFEVGLNISRFEQLIPAPAQAEYKKTMASAWAEYEKVDDAAWDEYEKVKATAWDEYEKVKATAWAEYAKIVALAWAEYEKVKATALVAALTS